MVAWMRMGMRPLLILGALSVCREPDRRSEPPTRPAQRLATAGRKWPNPRSNQGKRQGKVSHRVSLRALAVRPVVRGGQGKRLSSRRYRVRLSR